MLTHNLRKGQDTYDQEIIYELESDNGRFGGRWIARTMVGVAGRAPRIECVGNSRYEAGINLIEVLRYLGFDGDIRIAEGSFNARA